MDLRFFIPRSLKSRVTLASLGVFVLSSVLLGAYASRSLREDMGRELGAQQLGTVSLLAEQVNRELASRLTLLETAAELVGPAMQGTHARLQDHLDSRPGLLHFFNAGLFVTRTDGTVIADLPASANRMGLNVSERDYMVTALKDGKASVGMPTMGKSLKTPVFSIAAPIRDARGQVIGAMVGVVNLGKPNFLDNITANTYGRTGGYVLADLDSRLFITGTDKSRIMQKFPPYGVSPELDRFAQGFEGTQIFVNPLGVEVMASAKGIPAAGWVLAANLPTEEAFAPIQRQQQTMLVAVLLVAVLCCGLIWWLTARIVKRQLAPMLATTKALENRTIASQTPQTLPIPSDDEVGELIAGFNRLLDLIHHDAQRWRFAIEGAGAGVWDWNIQTGEAVLSRRWKEMLGYTETEIDNNANEWSSRVHPDDLPIAMQAIQAHMEGKTPSAVSEFRMRCKDGHYIWTLGRGLVVSHSADGRPLRLVGTQEDITECKRVEDAAHAANRAKSEFLANMSHEIRTPMNGVVGMVDILQETEMTPAQHRMLGTIQQSSVALLQILNDILDFSKIEAGKLDVESIPTHLTELAQGVVQLMEPVARAKSIELSVEVNPALPAWTLGDPVRLRQVLLNLLGNAVKFTRTTAASAHSARVSLRLDPCLLADSSAGIRIAVQDNGIGMAREVVAKLFQPFTQADESTARQFGGTGLGLSISQRLVALMGGRLTVTSEPGVGSELAVELPLLPCEPGQLKPALRSQPALPVEHRMRPRTGPRPSTPTVEEAVQSQRLILLAEDNETNRDVMLEQLHLLGYACEMAEDGALALQLWRAGQAQTPARYALLLTDCHMPNLDGFGLTQAIRQTETAGTHLPIIAITANAMQGEAQRCRERGMDDYLSKPLRMQELAAVLGKWLPLPAGVPDVALDPQRPAPVNDAENEAALPVWSPATLTELVGDNPVVHTRLLKKFLTTATAQVTGITAAAAANDTTTLAGIAHTLKSAARSVGALALGELCQSLETAGRAGDATACRELTGGLDTAWTVVGAKICDHLGTKPT
jgi:PAS domain S-box-containing protein